MSYRIDPESVASILEIQALKSRYFRFVDSKDWKQLAALFAPDATMQFEGFQSAPMDLNASIAFIGSALQNAVSVHHGHMPEIEILSSTSARGLWVMEDRIHWPKKKPNPLGLEYLHGLGHYHEDYVRPGDCWLIRRLKVTRQWVKTIPQEDP